MLENQQLKGTFLPTGLSVSLTLPLPLPVAGFQVGKAETDFVLTQLSSHRHQVARGMDIVVCTKH